MVPTFAGMSADEIATLKSTILNPSQPAVVGTKIQDTNAPVTLAPPMTIEAVLAVANLSKYDLFPGDMLR